jgi:uncharacterized membrane protein
MSRVRTQDRDPPGVAEVAFRGLPGHPLHPPLTDATIGMFVLATGLAVIGSAGVIEDKAGAAAWLALIGGLVAAVPTVAAGFADWIRLTWGSEVWRMATWHLGAMLTALACSRWRPGSSTRAIRLARSPPAGWC